MPLRLRRVCALVVLAICTAVGHVHAQSPEPSAAATAGARNEPSTAQGVAVVGLAGARDDAFALARAVYGSSQRPRALDEVRARVLAGDPAPPNASKAIHELAELRASVTSEDAASRRLLASIAHDVNAKALLVVSSKRALSPAADPDAGAAASAERAEADGGVASPGAGTHPVARLFLADAEEFDAARYEPDETGGWRSTVVSLSARFPAPAVAAQARPTAPPPSLSSDVKESKPFYASAWFWGAVGAAVVIGGFFYFATQDTDPAPIHLQMQVPR